MQPSTSSIPGLRPGELIRDYELREPSGRPMMLSDYRGRLNLILITADGAAPDQLTRLLRDLNSQADRLRENEAQVLMISSGREQFELPNIKSLRDKPGNVIRELGSPAVYVTDKFREVVHRFDSLPNAEDILQWVDFTAMQCPECHPPEWPVV